jgi:alpha-beta hydrolase superfamily lysophospholipase
VERTGRRSRGHEVYTSTLTGFGERSHLDAADGSFDTFVNDVVNHLRFEDRHHRVLAGQSMGGVVISRVARAVPERIGRVVWSAAAETKDTQSLMPALPRSRWVGSVAIGYVIGTDDRMMSGPDEGRSALPYMASRGGDSG